MLSTMFDYSVFIKPAVWLNFSVLDIEGEAPGAKFISLCIEDSLGLLLNSCDLKSDFSLI